MAAHNLSNSYLLDRAHIQEPPVSFIGRLRHLGPSLIVTANIVGSGELIMTTNLGAKAGVVTVWVVLELVLWVWVVEVELDVVELEVEVQVIFVVVDLKS